MPTKGNTTRQPKERARRLVSVRDPDALARALNRLVQDQGPAAVAAALDVDRTRLWRMRKGRAVGVREKVFMALVRELPEEAAREVFVGHETLSRIQAYADYMDRALKQFGLWLPRLGEVLSHPERYPVLYTAHPEWGRAVGHVRLKLILEGRWQPKPTTMSPAQAYQEAGLELIPVNALGEALSAEILRSWKGKYAGHWQSLRLALQRRWGRFSPETLAECALAQARILAPLLPPGVTAALEHQLASLAGPDEAATTRLRFVHLDGSGVSLQMEELDKRGLLAGYLSAAIRAELIRLDRSTALTRASSRIA